MLWGFNQIFALVYIPSQLAPLKYQASCGFLLGVEWREGDPSENGREHVSFSHFPPCLGHVSWPSLLLAGAAPTGRSGCRRGWPFPPLKGCWALRRDVFGRTDAKAETPVLWPPHAKS